MVIFSTFNVFLILAYGYIWQSQWPIYDRILQLILPILHMVILILISLGLLLLVYIYRNKSISAWITYHKAAFSIFALVLLLLWTFPFWFSSCHIVQFKELPSRPLITAHRGANKQAPENTVPSFEIAAQMKDGGLFALESDVQESLDGELIIMHDRNFRRTTNIKNIFPDKSSAGVHELSLSEIKELDAGSWFSDDYINTKVPTFKEVLDIVKYYQTPFIYDIYMFNSTLNSTIFYERAYDKLIEDIKEMQVDSLIYWLIEQERLDTEIKVLRERLPNATAIIAYNRASKPDLPLQYNISYINAKFTLYNSQIKELTDLGIGVNIYTVNARWLFDQLWLMNVTSVTTNYCERFIETESPSVWYISRNSYNIALVIIFIIHLASLGMISFKLLKERKNHL
eukprot:TRINITY_DN9796_c0_g1_i1.p1 TRINITY_DN9796_c0_g1~~TRINITY_DN9796_c0_g1_i1.p1  ORF type:complete len:400 (+),score=56.77 TRINITY_DN9796_c0_g1_i1:1697-2896(+)